MKQAEVIKTLKRMGWVALLFFTAAMVISAIKKKDTSEVREVIIDIEPLADSVWLIHNDDIQAMIELSFGYRMEGLPVESINVERLERVLEEDDFILDADVFLGARNILHIGVDQREPQLRIIDKNGLNYYLDKEGIKMKLSNHYSARVMVATGNIPPHVPDFLSRKQHVLKDLFYLKDLLKDDPFFNALVEQIYVSNRGEYILIPKIGRQKILLGKLNEIEDKLDRLKIFYKEAIPYEGWRKYKTINLKFKDQVIGEK